MAPAGIAGFARHGQWIEEGSPANLTVVDWDVEWIPQRFVSKASNSPFIGTALTGMVKATVYEGACTFAQRPIDGDTQSPKRDHTDGKVVIR